MGALAVAVIGIVVFIAGVAVATIKGTHLRGSGLGTLLMVVGAVLVIVAVWRYSRGNKPSK